MIIVNWKILGLLETLLVWRWHPTNYSFHDVQPWTPSFSCSLAYAVRRLAHWNLWLFKLDSGDAIFVKASLAEAVHESFGVRMPHDEMACYRQQHIWSPFLLLWPPLQDKETNSKCHEHEHVKEWSIALAALNLE